MQVDDEHSMAARSVAVSPIFQFVNLIELFKIS